VFKITHCRNCAFVHICLLYVFNKHFDFDLFVVTSAFVTSLPLQIFIVEYLELVRNCVSAFIGALYVDQGLASCTTFCQVCFFPRLKVSLVDACVRAA